MLVAAVMVLSTAVPAFAEDDGSNTLTIRNAVPGARYDAYRLLELATGGSGDGRSYAYRINPEIGGASVIFDELINGEDGSGGEFAVERNEDGSIARSGFEMAGRYVTFHSSGYV